MVPGDRWGFSGDLIRKAVPEVGNLTEAQGQSPIILTYPRTGVVGLTTDTINSELGGCARHLPESGVPFHSAPHSKYPMISGHDFMVLP